MTYQIPPLCEKCKWQYVDYDKKVYACKAFPDGVPMEIIRWKADHRKPYKGDNGIQFEPTKKGK